MEKRWRESAFVLYAVERFVHQIARGDLRCRKSPPRVNRPKTQSRKDRGWLLWVALAILLLVVLWLLWDYLSRTHPSPAML